MNTVFDAQAKEQIKDKSALFRALKTEIAKVIVGQDTTITFAEIAILCNGHILLEGVPGVAKTTLIKAFHKVLGLDFARIQFTPDLLPADLLGTLIYNQKTHEFETKKGPIFSHLILADEINRTPAKVQSALLEAMQEHQVTIGSTTFKLEEPFLVFATQNPLEQEGTYRLPEAQVDRFLVKLLVGYPSWEEEKAIIKQKASLKELQQIIDKDIIFESQDIVKSIYVDEKIQSYIVDIVFATREPKRYGLESIASYISYGVSPRATLSLVHCAQAYAFLQGRHFVIPDDVKFVAPAVLRHRIIVTYQAEADEVTSETLIHKILTTIPAP